MTRIIIMTQSLKVERGINGEFSPKGGVGEKGAFSPGGDEGDKAVLEKARSLAKARDDKEIVWSLIE